MDDAALLGGRNVGCYVVGNSGVMNFTFMPACDVQCAGRRRAGRDGTVRCARADDGYFGSGDDARCEQAIVRERQAPVRSDERPATEPGTRMRPCAIAAAPAARSSSQSPALHGHNGAARHLRAGGGHAGSGDNEQCAKANVLLFVCTAVFAAWVMLVVRAQNVGV